MRRAAVIGKSIPDGTNQLAQDPSLELAVAITVHRRGSLSRATRSRATAPTLKKDGERTRGEGERERKKGKGEKEVGV